MDVSFQAAPSPAVPSSTPSWLEGAHRWVAIAALLIAATALLTRSDIIKVISDLITRGNGGLNVPAPSFDPFLARVIHGVQAATILCFVVIHRTWLRQMASVLTDAMPVAKKTLEQFSDGWIWMWYCWAGLYVWFFFTAPWSESPRVAAVSDVLDVISGFNIWWCFLVLDMPSVKLDGHPHRDKAFRRTAWLVAVSGAVCAFLGAADRLWDWNHVGVVVGLYNALALAFLTGSLGSPYMKIRRGLLLCLYLYAMLQLFYSFLPLLKTAIWLPLIFLSALTLKIAVAYAGYEMLQYGGLQRYLAAAQSGALLVPWTSTSRVRASTLTSVDKELMRLVGLIDFRSGVFYLVIFVLSLTLALTAVGPTDFWAIRTAVVMAGMLVGISSGLALLKEGLAISHHTATRVCFIAAGFIMLIEAGLVLQLGLQLHAK